MGSESSRGGGNPPGGSPKALGVAHQPLVGWRDSPRGPYAPREENQGEKKKKGGGGKGRKESLPPIYTEVLGLI